jgi:hypothetical protein
MRGVAAEGIAAFLSQPASYGEPGATADRGSRAFKMSPISWHRIDVGGDIARTAERARAILADAT